MKRISYFLTAVLMAMPLMVRAQDAATEERLNKLSAQIQDLVDAKEAQNKRIEDLAKAIEALQQQMNNKPNVNYASQEDVKNLAAKLQEIDKKRQEDNDHIVQELEKLGKTLTKTPVVVTPTTSGGGGTAVPSKGYEYVIQQGDTLWAIITEYAKKNIKVTDDQILKANPGLDPKKMRVGQKIFIPAPTQ
jgi:LysM repeat protein